mgnify:CR=1 FL=1
MTESCGYLYVEHEREVNTYAELWHAASGPEFAARVLEDLERVFRAIHDTLPEPKEALFSFGFHTSGGRRA